MTLNSEGIKPTAISTLYTWLKVSAYYSIQSYTWKFCCGKIHNFEGNQNYITYCAGQIVEKYQMHIIIELVNIFNSIRKPLTIREQ